MSTSDRGRPPAERRAVYALGQAKYKERDFAAAVEQFTKALEEAKADVTSDPKITKPEIYRLLSARASSYTQMSDLKNAKNDLKECIELQPGDYRGYLSSASIFARENRFEKAYRFMDRADKLSPPDRLESNKRSRESIEAAEATYLASLGPRRINPVEVLPLEVFTRILELGVDDNQPDFALRPSWVSVKWRAAALASSPAWKSFSWKSESSQLAALGTRKTQALLKKTEAWDERSNGNIERCALAFNRIDPCPLPLLFPFLDRWLPRVKELDIEQHCHGEKYPRTGTCVYDYKGQMAQRCQTLHACEQDVERLISPGNTTLHRLNTARRYDVDDLAIGISEDVLGSVTHWTVERQTIFVQFRYQDMRKMRELKELHVTLDDKVFCRNVICCNRNDEALQSWPPAEPILLPKLEVLLGLPLVYIQGLECPALVWLELGQHCGCYPTIEPDPIGFLQRSKVDLMKIERLVLSRLGGLSVNILEATLPQLRSLDYLDVREGITNTVVELLADLTSLPGLKTLLIRNARGLTGGPILRMVESRLKKQRTSAGALMSEPRVETIQKLHLLQCDMLEKAAEDWLKRNVAEVVIIHVREPKAGYRDKMAR